MTLSRSFKVSILISTVIHAGVFAALDREPVSQRVLASPKPLLAMKPKPKAVQFELIDTPASAEAPGPPEKTDLMSDKNTRAQDMFKGDKKLEDSPHMEGASRDSKDTRPRAQMPRQAVLPKPSPEPRQEPSKEPAAEASQQPAPADEKKEPPKPLPMKEKEPAEPAERIQIAKRAEGKEVVRLARKEPPLPEPVLPKSPAAENSRLMSSASVNNTGADAQITGELSFGATRHFFGEYLLKMKQRVEADWISRLVSQYAGHVKSQAVIDFKIQPDGRVTGVEINSTEGDPYFALMCISSIRDAQPFDRIPYDDIAGLPEDFKGKPLSIRFTFRYN